MVFSQILKNVLDKNREVWIPTIGLLGYDKATSKLVLDAYSSGTDGDLISLIADIKQVSAGEAKGILIQEVEAVKSIINNEGKYVIDGLGDLTLSNGSYQFEVKKTLFPTDFFGGGNFNASAFKDNAPKEESKAFEPTFIKVAPPKIEPIKETPIELPKVEEEPPKDLFEAAKFITPEIESPKIEEVIVAEPVLVDAILQEVDQPEKEDFATRLLNEISQEDDDETIDEEDDTSEEENTIIPSIALEETKKIVIDEPRKNAGNGRYDDGYYDFDEKEETKPKSKWLLVAGLSIGILAVGFMIPWLIASSKGTNFLGLKPLWKSNKEDIKKIEPNLAVLIDSAAIDSAKMMANLILADSLKKDSLNKKIAVAAPHTEAKTAPAKAASPTPVTPSKTPSTQPTQTNTKNTTSPKTPNSAGPTVGKKTVAVATEKIKKTEVVNGKKEAVSISQAKEIPKREKDSSSKQAKAKPEKATIIGKPYATANYTKGNHYLSFGKFKIAMAAVKLKNDMKKNAGIETDVILLDGSYRVVVPYLSKDKAEAASKDYVSTTLFE